METYEMMMRRRAREAAKRAKIAKFKTIASEIFSLAVFIGLIYGFCWLCCAVGGYHWE